MTDRQIRRAGWIPVVEGGVVVTGEERRLEVVNAPPRNISRGVLVEVGVETQPHRHAPQPTMLLAFGGHQILLKHRRQRVPHRDRRVVDDHLSLSRWARHTDEGKHRNCSDASDTSPSWLPPRPQRVARP